MGTFDIISKSLALLGALGVFLLGMKIMSEALQKVAGERLKQLLKTLTANRVSGVMTGFLVTCIVQSSSATTVMVVSFVNARLLDLTQSIGVVMGANIGTTITAWLVALLGFKVKLTHFALPAIGVGLVLTFVRGARARQWGEVTIGFGLLFLGLGLLKKSVPSVDADQLAWMDAVNQYGILSTLIFVGVGTVLTVLLQSSSATMTLTLTMTAMGIIPYDASIAMVLGENIGTTATANLAAIGASTTARRTARAHLLFNLIGVTWAIATLHWLLMPLVDVLIPGDPERALIELGPDAGASVVASHVALFHSMFNITNTLLLLPFVKQIATFVTRWVPDSTKDELEHQTSKFISSNLVQTPELLVIQVGKEMQHMADVTHEMFRDAMRILDQPTADLGNLVDETFKREQKIDSLEREITSVLTMTARAATSAEAARRLSEMALNTHRLERIGDHCEKLVGIAVRNHQSTEDNLDPSALRDIKELGELVERALVQLGRYLAGEGSPQECEAIENEIDATRDRLRSGHMQRMQGGEERLVAGLWALDALAHLEEIGDRCWGIVKRAEETKHQ